MKRRKNIHVDTVAYAFIAPYYIFLILFILIPVVVNIFLGFTNYNMNMMDFVGMRNYVRLLSDSILKKSVLNTLYYTAFTLTVTVGAGLLVAIVITKTGKAQGIFRTFIFLPYVVAMASAAMIWLWMYEPGFGFFNVLLGLLGLPLSNWLFDEGIAIFCVAMVSFWKTLGYNMVIFTAGLMGIPGQLYEAARIDGANVWQEFRFVTLPMLRPTTFFLLVTGFIGNFNVFEQVRILTSGGPVNSTTTIMHQIYQRGFVDYQLGYASAITIVMMVIVSVITALNFRFGSKGQDLDLS
jgi:multiple sugar transport system permease protein/raffinose/stachyose/melibiose transport system permease protein